VLDARRDGGLRLMHAASGIDSAVITRYCDACGWPAFASSL